MENISKPIYQQKTINKVRNWMSGTEQRLAEDITDQEVIDYIKDMGEAHGGVENYFEFMYSADHS
jgi:hypothetical protein